MHNRQKALKLSIQGIRLAVQQVFSLERVVVDEVSIHLVGPTVISRLHRLHFGDPSVTDCISFPLTPNGNYWLLGDVFVCPAVALQYAQHRGLDPQKETLLYIVHGLLHLLGYDDIDPTDRKKMRRAERRHMNNLQQFALNSWV